MRATSLIFGIIIASLVMSSFGLMMADLGDSYSVTYNNSYISLYDKLNDTQTQAYDLWEKTNTSQQDTNAIDVLGGFVTKAVESLKLTYKSLTSGIEMVGTAQQDLDLPANFNTAFGTILLVFIVLGVIISAMIKKDM